MPYLTIARNDPSVPAGFPSPHGTVTARVDEDVLYIDVKSPVDPADWYLASALMGYIAQPDSALTKSSALSAVNWWSVRVI